MVVESRYNIGDMVWMISSNKTRQEKVSGVFICVRENEVIITYTVDGNDDNISENSLFSSKEELLKSL